MPTLPIRCPPQSPFIDGFDTIRSQLEIPGSFSAAVLEEAADSAKNGPRLPAGVPTSTSVIDRRDIEFVTVDPPGSQDLDQAYAAERRDGGFRVFYAIADVAAFIAHDGPISAESLERAVTLYSPDMRTPLHPVELSEGAASLLADKDRPALLWTIDLDAEGRLEHAHLERATVRSREQLDYQTAQDRIDNGTAHESLALLKTIGQLREALEAERGAVSLSLPSQEVVHQDDGTFVLEYDISRPVEGWNAQISLLTGIAAAKIMLDGGHGLLRTLPEPYGRTVRSIREAAKALGIDWPKDMKYADRVRELDPNIAREAALLTQSARALRGAGYVAFNGDLPELRTHSAIASEYAHVTAPLRRVADRYANEAILALCGGYDTPEWALSALPEIPSAMGRGVSKDRRLEKAIVDFVEAVVLQPHKGKTFDAVVVDVDEDDNRSKIQLKDPAVVARIATSAADLGAEVQVRLDEAIPEKREITFSLVEP